MSSLYMCTSAHIALQSTHTVQMHTDTSLTTATEVYSPLSYLLWACVIWVPSKTLLIIQKYTMYVHTWKWLYSMEMVAHSIIRSKLHITSKVTGGSLQLGSIHCVIYNPYKTITILIITNLNSGIRLNDTTKVLLQKSILQSFYMTLHRKSTKV